MDDGRILSQSVVTLTDDALAQIEEKLPEIRAVVTEVEVQSIIYLSDGLKVKGYLLHPREGDDLPCLIVNRGGAGEVGAWTDSFATAFLARLARWGYIVVTSQIRGGPGSEGSDEFCGRDINDALNLIPLLESLPRADSSRIGMYGISRGAITIYCALARTDRIAAAIVQAGASDLDVLFQHRPDLEEFCAPMIPNYAEDRDAALAQRSAARWPERLHKKTPILILHGSADWRAPPIDALTMALKLYACKHPFRLVFFEGGEHNLFEHFDEAARLIRNWLDAYVRDRKPIPNMEPHGT